jgi:signal transduction histidine kinase
MNHKDRNRLQNLNLSKIIFEEHFKIDKALNPAFALNLFRICQETINNAFKHANATEIYVSVEQREKIIITISDNGVGFNKDNLQENNQYGLTNLFSRAKAINASINIESAINQGCKITIVV